MLRRLLVTALVGVGLAAAFATPAYAAAYSCNSSNVCLWTNLNYEGTRQMFSGFNSYADTNSALHDKASSWGSSTNSQIMCVINYVGGTFEVLGTLNPGNRTSWVGPSLNDKSDAVVQSPQWTNC